MALPTGAASLDEADAAIELWEHYKGRTLDAGQRLDVQVMLATRDDGLWAAGLTGHEKPRQSGKGDSIEVVEFWGLTQRSERILHTIHDAVLLATETHSRMLSLIESHADLRRLKARAWKGTGQQMIEMRNGGIIWYRTRTGSGGRGLDEVDRVVVDEAQHAELSHLSSITPTQAVAANPQLNALGTGGLEGKSEWWWNIRKQAKGEPGAFAYLGWSAQPWDMDANGNVTLTQIDPDDESLWWETIPGLVAGRTSLDFLYRERRQLGREGFAQEYLCVWAPPPGVGSGVIDMALWADLADSTSVVASHHSWALSVSPDRQWACIGLAGRRADGLPHVEWLEGCHGRGTHWVVAKAAELYERRKIPLRVATSSAEASLIDELTEAGVEVLEVNSAEVARCTGEFIDAARNKELRHLSQPSLTMALEHAELRTSEAGASVWMERSSQIEITPLKAVTVALGGVEERKRAPRIHVYKPPGGDA